MASRTLRDRLANPNFRRDVERVTSRQPNLGVLAQAYSNPQNTTLLPAGVGPENTQGVYFPLAMASPPATGDDLIEYETAFGGRTNNQPGGLTAYRNAAPHEFAHRFQDVRGTELDDEAFEEVNDAFYEAFGAGNYGATGLSPVLSDYYMRNEGSAVTTESVPYMVSGIQGRELPDELYAAYGITEEQLQNLPEADLQRLNRKLSRAFDNYYKRTTTSSEYEAAERTLPTDRLGRGRPTYR